MSLRLISASTHRGWSIQPPTASSPSLTVSLPPSLRSMHRILFPYPTLASSPCISTPLVQPIPLLSCTCPSTCSLPACLPACPLPCLPGFLHVRPSVCAFVSSLSVVYRTLIQPSIRLTHPPLTVHPLLSSLSSILPSLVISLSLMHYISMHY